MSNEFTYDLAREHIDRLEANYPKILDASVRIELGTTEGLPVNGWAVSELDGTATLTIVVRAGKVLPQPPETGDGKPG
jgi:hypothetical protein